MKRSILVLIAMTFAFSISTVSATNYGSIGANLYAGQVVAQSSSSTVGGSSFAVGVNANGAAKGYAESAGGGTASAGGNINKNGVTTFSNNTSYSSGDAKSHIRGNGTGTGSAAQGTDVNSAAVGQFGKIGTGFGAGLSFGH